MTTRVDRGGLAVAAELANFIEEKALPGRAPPISFEGQSIRRIFWKKLKELRDNW